MNLGVLASRSLVRNRARTVLTALGVAVAVLTFVLLRTVLVSWTASVDAAVQDRIATRHKVTFVMTLPKHYAQDIGKIPGLGPSTYSNWFGAKDPNDENEFFATIAVDPVSFLEVYDEILVTPEDRKRWLENRRGALVGDMLAKKKGWKVGDVITLTGTIYPGDWQFEIAGLYTATRKSVDRSTLWFHWDYLNDALSDSRKDQIGWISTRVRDPSRAADISKAIDTTFDEMEVPTLTMSERAMNSSFLASFSAILTALDVVSMVILGIMTLILGNTIAMGTRERTGEFGIMRAIGFRPRHIAIIVLAEGLIIAALGGGLGLVIAYPFVEQGLGRWLEENMGGFFPFFDIAPETSAMALGLACVLGLFAAILPARRAARLNAIDAIRRIA